MMGQLTPTWPASGATGWATQMNTNLGSIVTNVNAHDTQLGGLAKNYASGTSGYDIILLLGQSNMSGRAVVDTVNYDIPQPIVDQYAAAGPQAGVISAAVDPLGQADYVALGNTLGPGTTFARWYSTLMPAGRRILLVPAAYGGTPLVSAVSPLGWRRGVAGNLYAQALAQAQGALVMAGAGAQIVAALWVQGEADGNANITGAAYQSDLDALISGLRTDLGVPNLPFIIGGMVPEYLSTGTRAAIDTVQAATPGRQSYVGYAAGPHNQNLGDGNHYNAVGARLLGRYMFTAYNQVVNGTAAPIADDGNFVITNSTVPTITGTKTVGQTLTATNGTWSTTPTSYTYQWYSGDVAIGGAVNSTYVLTAADVGAHISVTVTAIKSGYRSASASSVNTAVVITNGSTYWSDTFTRANSATTMGSTSTGALAWTAQSGTWGITSNDAYDAAPTASTNHSVVVSDTHADGTISVTIGSIGTNGGSPGIIFRATDDSNYLMFSGGGTVYTRIAGTFTSLGGSGQSLVNGDVLTVTLNGSSITARINGSVIWSGTSTFNQTATKHGLRSYGATSLTYAAASHTA